MEVVFKRNHPAGYRKEAKRKGCRLTLIITREAGHWQRKRILQGNVAGTEVLASAQAFTEPAEMKHGNHSFSADSDPFYLGEGQESVSDG